MENHTEKRKTEQIVKLNKDRNFRRIGHYAKGRFRTFRRFKTFIENFLFSVDDLRDKNGNRFK